MYVRTYVPDRNNMYERAYVYGRVSMWIRVGMHDVVHMWLVRAASFMRAFEYVCLLTSTCAHASQRTCDTPAIGGEKLAGIDETATTVKNNASVGSQQRHCALSAITAVGQTMHGRQW